MLLSTEISEQLSPDEYVKLCEKVEDTWHKAFGIVQVNRTKLTKTVVIEVELDDDTRHKLAIVP